MLNSDLIWCQGYSEPGSGSDLASLRTKAVREGDFYIVNGQKTWTTLAQTADWIFCLVRTSNEGKRQEGISFLLIDMKTPGISVEPIITADGNRAGTQEVNSVFLDRREGAGREPGRRGEQGLDLRQVPARVRARRQSVQPAPALGLRAAEAAVAQAMPDGEDSIMADAAWREKLARMDIEISGLEMFEQEFYSKLAAGQNPGPLSSMIKLRGTEVMQQVQEYAVEAAGYYSPAVPRAARLERQCRADRARGRRRAGAALLQRPQDDDLRRLVGSAARDHVQGDAGALTSSVANAPPPHLNGEAMGLALAPHSNGEVPRSGRRSQEKKPCVSVLQRRGTRLPAGSARLDRGQHAARGGRRRAGAAAPATSPRSGWLQWQKKLAGKGWLCPNWPKEHGGPGWTLDRRSSSSRWRWRAPICPISPRFSIKMVAPVLMKYGSEAQKKRFLPKIAAAEELWCQGYSEPGSGSDLASACAPRRNAARRPLRRERPEDLDHQRPLRRLDLLPRAAPPTRASARRASPSC